MNIRPLLVAGLLAPGLSHAVITISGVSDRQELTNSATFTVNGATSALLDGAPVPIGQPVVVNSVRFHELEATDGTTTQLVRFIVKSSERGETEDGLPRMMPYHYVDDAPQAFAGGVLSIMAPAQFPKNLPIPIVGRLLKGEAFGGEAGDPLWLHGRVTAAAAPTRPIQLRRGWGSTILPAQTVAGTLTYDAAVNGLSDPAGIVIEPETEWTTRSGAVGASDDWGMNARIHITGNITVGAGATLTIGAGTIVRCAPGVEIWVAPGGNVVINGTVDTPVVFVPDVTTQLWGGIWLQPASGAATAQLTATGAIFCCWGANPNWLSQAPHNNFPAHRSNEPCFAVSADATLTLTDCALVGPIGLADPRGSLFAANDGTMIVTRTLAQRAITGGELEGGAVTFESSAIIELSNPGIDVDSTAFIDADNDGLYLVPGAGRTHQLTKTLIGWVKDDGIDTGASAPGSTILMRCWFENCVHEACSNSGTNKVPEAHDCVMINCGQGMECGYESPQSLVDHCAIIACMVGARFGDNYDWDYEGHLTVRDSIILHSLFNSPARGTYNDVWGMEWDSWTYRTDSMTVEDNYLTAANTAHPDNTVWDPVTHGPLLAPFMPVPDSDVGVDLLVPARQDILANYPGRFDVRLSTFSSRPVSVGWQVIGKPTPESVEETVVASGTLPFTAGEMLKAIEAPLPGGHGFGFVAVQLESPSNAALTGAPAYYFASDPPPPDLELIGRGAGGWSYQALRQEPANDTSARPWEHKDYIETNWQQNRTAPIGFGTIGQSTVVPIATTLSAAEQGPSTDRTRAVYFRRAFSVDDPSAVRSLSVELLRDDAAVIYLNGVEVIRHNIDSGSVPGGTITYSTLASSGVSGDNESTRQNLTVPPTLLVNLLPGANLIAVEVHQDDAASSDLVLDLRLSAGLAGASTGAHGIGSAGGNSFLYWVDDRMTPESSDDLEQWTPHPELASPIRLPGPATRQFFRLVPLP